MNQTGHIFAKDARHHLWEAGIVLAFLAAMAWLGAYQFMPEGWVDRHAGYPATMRLVGGLAIGFAPVTWWVLVTRLVHGENLVGDRQWWITKPYEWSRLLGAKAGFVAAFVLLPLVIADCVLLAVGGFSPLQFLGHLGWGLVLLTAFVLAPLMALAAVTSSFARLALTMLGLLAVLIAVFVVLAIAAPGGMATPLTRVLALPIVAGGSVAAIVLQYAQRREWVARGVLAGTVIVLVGALLLSETTPFVKLAYPRGAAPFAMNYDAAAQPGFTSMSGNHRVSVPVPVSVSGIEPGTVANVDGIKLTVDGANGRTWTSNWEPMGGTRFDANRPSGVLGVQMSDAVYSAMHSQPVTMRLRLALTQLRAVQTTTVQLTDHEFTVPQFGICAPDPLMQSGQFGGFACRTALRQPPQTLISVEWSDVPCAERTAQSAPVAGEGWAGSADEEDMSFNLLPVTGVGFSLSNSSQTNPDGSSGAPRYLCAGTPVTFTRYAMTRRVEYDVTLENVKLPEMKNEGAQAE